MWCATCSNAPGYRETGPGPSPCGEIGLPQCGVGVNGLLDVREGICDFQDILTGRIHGMADRVDVKDLTIGDLLAFIKKLKISSIIWIISTIVVLISGAYGAGVASSYLGVTKPRFVNSFADRFVDRDVLAPLISAILEEQPDGIGTGSEAMLSLLWQLKSQDGYAQFLSDDDYISVQITETEDGFDLEWDEGVSLIPKILNDLLIPYDHRTIEQLNAEMNLIGVAWLSDRHHVVRDIDGGLQVSISE